MKNAQDSLDVKNTSDLVLKEIYGRTRHVVVML